MLKIENFAFPPDEYRPVAFWSWNELMELKEIRRQVCEMKAAGFGGCFIHSRIGLLTEYLSNDWFESVDAAIDESKKCGLKISFYDEDKWPSGFAGGRVPLENSAYRMKTLFARPVEQIVPLGAEAIGKHYGGIQVYKWTVPLGHDWFNGTCFTDLMSKSAVKCFIKHSYDSYYQKYKDLYGTDIVYEFTDEPCTIYRANVPEGSVPFSEEFFEAFGELNGYNATDHLYKLFFNDENAQKFRIDYFRTVNYQFEQNFSKQISDWCSGHNIGLIGHYMSEHDMYDQQLWGTKIMPNYRHLHVPGIDHLGLDIDYPIVAKQCQSVVNQYGKSRMMSELYGCCGQGATFEDRLWIATEQIQLGVNLLVPHLLSYTMAGCRKRDYPPNLFYQQPWWRVNPAMDIPLSRLCYAMSRGRCHSKILVIHPQESTFALWQTKYENLLNICMNHKDVNPITQESRSKIFDLNESLNTLIAEFLHNQINFDFGDETILAQDGEVMVEDGETVIRIGMMSYKAVVLPEMHTISPQTVRILDKFKQMGGDLMAYRNTPELMDGHKSDVLEKFMNDIPKRTVSGIVLSLKQKDDLVTFFPEGEYSGYLWTHVRRLENGEVLLFVSNLNRAVTLDGTLKINGGWKTAILLDHWSGTEKAVTVESHFDGIGINLSLAPVQSRLFLLGDSRGQFPLASLGSTLSNKSFELTDISVKRLDDNAIILDTAFWAEAGDMLSACQVPINAIQGRLNKMKYNGSLTLKFCFNTSEVPLDHKICLVVEHPENYIIEVNGREVRYAGLPYWLDIRFLPISIREYVVEGENHIVLRCNNFRYGDLTSVNDYAARYGTEIESIYIVGDFSVQGEYTNGSFDETYWNISKLKPPFKYLRTVSAVVTAPKDLLLGDVTEDGLPFYAGRLEYRTSLPELEIDSERIILRLEKFNAAFAEIFIDDKQAGHILSQPYEIDLTDIYKGGACLKIVLYSTLRNLLGPHHDKGGNRIYTGPEAFMPQFETSEGYDLHVERWAKGNEMPDDWQDDYVLVNFGEIGRLVVDVIS